MENLCLRRGQVVKNEKWAIDRPGVGANGEACEKKLTAVCWCSTFIQIYKTKQLETRFEIVDKIGWEWQ